MSNAPTNPQFSLVILCYRAEESIVPFVEKVHELFSWINISYELVLVGNYWPNTPDKTPQIVRELCERMPHTNCVTLPKEGAMGWDLRTGFAAARGEYVGFIDGDGQFPIDSILPPLYHALARNVDLAKTYRVVRGDGPFRLLISFVFNNLFRVLFGTKYRDVNSKPKIFKQAALKAMNLESNDWFIDAEIMIKAHRMKLDVFESPIHFVENENRSSFVRLSSIWEFVKNLGRARFQADPRE